MADDIRDTLIKLTRSKTTEDFRRILAAWDCFSEIVEYDWLALVPIEEFIHTRDEVRVALHDILSDEGVGDKTKEAMKNALDFFGIDPLDYFDPRYEWSDSLSRQWRKFRRRIGETAERLKQDSKFSSELQRMYMYFFFFVACVSRDFGKNLRICPQCGNFFLYHPRKARGACCSKKCGHAYTMKKYQRKRRAKLKKQASRRVVTQNMA